MSTYKSADKTLHKEIHPEQEKRIETEQKLKQAKHGELPPNKDINTGINKIHTGINANNEELSATGQKVTGDINQLLETTKQIVNDKNEGELLQNAYYHSHQAGSNKSYSERVAELKQMATGNVGATREDAKKNVSSFGTIVKLALLSPEFRDSINDVADIVNQLLKNQSEKNSSVSSTHGSHDEPRVEAKTVQETHIAEKAISRDGNVEATVVETTPVTKFETNSGSRPVDKKARREEKEEKLIERLIDLAQTLHKEPEFRNSVEYLSESASKLKLVANDKKGRMNQKSAEDKSKEDTLKVQQHKKEARMNGKEFLENWIGDDYSLDRLINQIVFLQEKSKTDPELRQLLKDWKKWGTSTVKDEAYVNDRSRMREDIKDLISRTRYNTKKYNEEVSIIRREAVFINKSIQHDDTLLKLRSDFQQLGNDLVKDSNGNPTVKPELLGDAQIIIASLAETIKYIPLPPITRKDNDMEVQLENIVLNVTNITPSNIRMTAQTDMDKNADGSRQHDNSFLIDISKVRAHLTSVNFFVDKKTGFPKITERGLADIDLTNNGLSLRIEVVPKAVKSGNEVHSVFEAKTVTCSIDKLKIHLRETSHDTLFKILSPIINMVAKKKIETGIADAIKENMNKLNANAANKATKTNKKADQKMQEKKQHS